MMFLYVSQDFVILIDGTSSCACSTSYWALLWGREYVGVLQWQMDNKPCRAAAYTKRTCGPWYKYRLEACGMEGLLDAQPCRRGP